MAVPYAQKDVLDETNIINNLYNMVGSDYYLAFVRAFSVKDDLRQAEPGDPGSR